MAPTRTSMLAAIKSRLRGRMRALIEADVDRRLAEIVPSLLEFTRSQPEDKQSFYDRTKDPVGQRDSYLATRGRLLELGVPLEDVSVDIADFRKWLAGYPEVEHAYRDAGDVRIEKCLEHYLSFTLLGLHSRDTFVDVAAARSPFAEVLHRRVGLTAYRLDLSFRKGIHGRDIGADAGDTGLPDGFASALALHCAFECFMGDADVRFVAEAARILRPGGRYAIAPLYVDETYTIATSPYCRQEGLVFDPGARKVWRDDAYHVPFSRHYSPQSLIDRIYARIPTGMAGKVHFVDNLVDVGRSFPGQRIYCYFAFICRKR